VDSVGGFVTSLLGHVPAQGDRITFENIEFSVERVDGHRIAQVRITRADPAAAVDN
jgi:putative hemolysin